MKVQPGQLWRLKPGHNSRWCKNETFEFVLLLCLGRYAPLGLQDEPKKCRAHNFFVMSSVGKEGKGPATMKMTSLYDNDIQSNFEEVT